MSNTSQSGKASPGTKRWLVIVKRWVVVGRKAMIMSGLASVFLLAMQSHSYAGVLGWLGVAAAVVGVGCIVAVAVLGDGLTLAAGTIAGAALVKVGAATALVGAVAIVADAVSTPKTANIPIIGPVKLIGSAPANPPPSIGPTQMAQVPNPTNDPLTTDANNAIAAADTLLHDSTANPGAVDSDFANLASTFGPASKDNSAVFFGDEQDAAPYADFTQSQFNSIQSEIAANGLPSEVVDELTSAGFTTPEIQELTNFIDSTPVDFANPPVTTANLLADGADLVPEPSSLAVIGVGLVGTALARRRRRS